jgi:MoxR-like ATPase
MPELLELRNNILREVTKVVIGQDAAVDQILIALATRGHALLEGPPGTAKTLLANAIARTLGVKFRRVQFTPDMLPSDLTGTMALVGGQIGDLAFRPGPIFSNIVLADEVNRTPPKTQAALLEAMGEGTVTVDGVTHKLQDPFLVVATQNPIEYEGTYPLPEAQLDRFTVKVMVGYPTEEQEVALLGLRRAGVRAVSIDDVQQVAGPEQIESLRALVDSTGVHPDLPAYAIRVVRATRSIPSVELGASPRAAVHLMAAAKAAARFAGRDFLTPDDIALMAPPVLRHRIMLRPEAELEGYKVDDIIRLALGSVTVPR